MGAILDASTLRDAMSLYLEALEAHREEIDSLNVFPLPDGDTGTNMLLTQRAIVEALEGREGEGLRELGGMIARAALMGARGNSGVILSQILRGFCDRYTITEGEGRMAPDGMDVAGALSAADEEARKAVSEPVEGTILSVLRDAARAATDRARETSDVDSVLEAAFDAAKSSLARTTQALPELKEAGVVDAGGKGLVLLFDAMVSAVRGIPLSTEVGPLGPVGHVEQPAGASTRYGYEVMYLLEGEHAEIPRLRRRLTEVGDSVVVVGGGDMWNVHVHTDDAGTALAAGVAAGTPRAIRISSLDEEVAAHCVADEFRGVVVGDEVPEAPSDLAAPEEKEQALLAVADGAGLEEIFRSLGVAVVRETTHRSASSSRRSRRRRAGRCSCSPTTGTSCRRRKRLRTSRGSPRPWSPRHRSPRGSPPRWRSPQMRGPTRTRLRWSPPRRRRVWVRSASRRSAASGEEARSSRDGTWVLPLERSSPSGRIRPRWP
jgi:DAK2 domain fusion protein YloV